MRKIKQYRSQKYGNAYTRSLVYYKTGVGFTSEGIFVAGFGWEKSTIKGYITTWNNKRRV